jgi:hypothetical protein
MFRLEVLTEQGHQRRGKSENFFDGDKILFRLLKSTLHFLQALLDSTALITNI